MTEKLALLAWSLKAEAPDLCAAPFVYATAAAALDCEVEIHFAGPAVALLVEGVAANAYTGGGKPLYGFMREAANLGVRFLVCAMARRQHVATGQTLIPEVCGEPAPPPSSPAPWPRTGRRWCSKPASVGRRLSPVAQVGAGKLRAEGL